jgi:hypothetical protein
MHEAKGSDLIDIGLETSICSNLEAAVALAGTRACSRPEVGLLTTGGPIPGFSEPVEDASEQAATAAIAAASNI